MSSESLKRVLMGIKSEARGMRKKKLEGRINPAPEPVTPGAEVMAEGSDEEESAESPDVEAAEEPAADPAATIEEIRKLIAKV